MDNIELANLAKIIGYNEIPVDIETFVNDSYYLGNLIKTHLYPYWLEKLKELYPSPITTSNRIVILNGGLGTGKSTFTMICTLYNLYRLNCRKVDFDIDFQFVGLRDFSFEDLRRLYYYIDHSPYFMDNKDLIDSCIHIYSIDPRTELHNDHKKFQYSISDLDYFDINLIESKLKEAIENPGPLFIELLSKSNNKILESSLKGYEKEILIINDPIWVVKDHTKAYWNLKDDRGRNYFYISVNENNLSESEIILYGPIPEDQKIIKVPLEFLEDFKYDMESSLKDLAGIPKFEL